MANLPGKTRQVFRNINYERWNCNFSEKKGKEITDCKKGDGEDSYNLKGNRINMTFIS